MTATPIHSTLLRGNRTLPGLVMALLVVLALGMPLLSAEPDGHRLRMAREWTVQGDLEKALREYRTLLVDNPDNTEIYREMAEVHILQKRPDLAIDAYKKMAERVKPEAKASIEAKIAALEKSRAGATSAKPSDEGAAGDSEVEGKSPPKSGIYADPDFLKSIERYRAKDNAGALAAIHKTLAKHRGHPGAYYLAGVIRYNQGEYAKARYNFQKSFPYPDKGNNAHFYLGRIYEKTDKPMEAIQSFRTYIKGGASPEGKRQAEARIADLQARSPSKPTASVAPTAPTAPIPRPAVKPDSARQPDKAKARVADSVAPGIKFPLIKVMNASGFPPDEGQRFFLPEPDKVGGREMEAALEAYREGRPESAIRQLRRIILDYAGSANAEAAALNLATIYLKLGLTDNAEVQVNDYLRASPATGGLFREHAEYLSSLTLLADRDWVPAEQILTGLRQGKTYGPSEEALGIALVRVGEMSRDSTKLQAYLEKAEISSRLPHRQALFRQQLGFLHQQKDRLEPARKLYRSSLEQCGKAQADSAFLRTCSLSRLRLADLEFSAKNWQTSLELYLDLLKIHPGFPESDWVHYQIANVYKSQKRYDLALNEYGRVIDNYPYSYWAAQAKWRREDTIWRKEFGEVID